MIGVTPEPEWMLRLVARPSSGNEFTLEQIESRLAGVHQTLAFSRKKNLSAILVPDLHNALFPVILMVSAQGTASYSGPEFAVTGRGFSLGGLHVHQVHEQPDAALYIDFSFALGRMQDIVMLHDQIGRQVLSHRERIAVSALADIASPLISLASMPASQIAAPETKTFLTDRLAQISDRADELQFHLSMLMRYVRNCAEVETGGPLVALKPDYGADTSRATTNTNQRSA